MLAPFLLLGGNGQIGRSLCERGAIEGLTFVVPPRSEVDLTDTTALAAAVGARRWQAVINCAAYTRVDEAETDVDLAWSLNADAPETLARTTAAAGVPIIHVSSDYVFDGTKGAPYVETDRCNPLNTYGLTKWAGEEAIRAGNPDHMIIRTSWVVSAGEKNFVAAMLRAATRPDPVRVVADQRGTPTGADDVAAAICASARQAGQRRGTWHFANSGEASWYDVAACVFTTLRMHGKTVPHLQPIASSDYPMPARRPGDSRLSVDKFDNDFGLARRPWEAMVEWFVTRSLRNIEGNTP